MLYYSFFGDVVLYCTDSSLVSVFCDCRVMASKWRGEEVVVKTRSHER